MAPEDLETMRDVMAIAAMHAMLSSFNRGDSGRLFDEDVVAKDAYLMADQMIKARNVQPKHD